MKKLQNTLRLKDVTRKIDTTFVQFLSFSVDPERDSVPRLKTYADRYGVNHDVWWLLTGDAGVLAQAGMGGVADRLSGEKTIRMWTDDYSSLLPLVEWGRWR